MKKLILSLVVGATSFANAAVVPTGSFDCSLKKGMFHVSIAETSAGITLEVHHQVNNEQTTLSGFALIVNQKLADGSEINRLRLAGSTVELFFDAQGNVGLDRDALNCRKM